MSLAVWRPLETRDDRRIVSTEFVDHAGGRTVAYAGERLVDGVWRALSSWTADEGVARRWLAGDDEALRE